MLDILNTILTSQGLDGLFYPAMERLYSVKKIPHQVRNDVVIEIITLTAREARRTKLTTAHPNSRKYARCEWKCIAFIGHTTSPHKESKPVPINARHCSGQRGDYQIEDDTRRPINQVEGRPKF